MPRRKDINSILIIGAGIRLRHDEVIAVEEFAQVVHGQIRLETTIAPASRSKLLNCIKCRLWPNGCSLTAITHHQ